ncbi:hypothetical protein V8C42DRAFT_330724 [Trichoderma barbatum]
MDWAVAGLHMLFLALLSGSDDAFVRTVIAYTLISFSSYYLCLLINRTKGIYNEFMHMHKQTQSSKYTQNPLVIVSPLVRFC